MDQVRLTKSYEFEMAHALWNYDGLCKNIHGHSYKLFVTVIGKPLDDESSPKDGMVIDFGDLKRIVKTEIVDVFDHSMVINAKAPNDILLQLGQMYERYHVFEFQPTCENFVIYIAHKIIKNLPSTVKLKSIQLYETATSFAEWNADDNQ